MKATFGAGCFWHVEEEFSKYGKTAVGFMGGHKDNPTYKEVCRGDTGHAEICQVEYDPKKVPYERLLDVFWSVHDPTQFNQQGPDVGEQYRSVIFYHSEKQKKAAEESLKKQEKKIGKKIMTAIEKAGDFWRAEEYHQMYFKKHKIYGKVCEMFI